MINANSLTLYCNTQCFTCQFKIILLKELFELLRTQYAL